MRDRRRRSERHCPTPWCSADRLAVEHDSQQDDLWTVTGTDGRRWVVAADAPVCPQCGATLQLATAGRAEAVDADETALVGPVFEYIRRLAA